MSAKRKRREKEQVQRIMATVLAHIRAGTTLRVDLTPGVILREFQAPIHVFYEAMERLRHMTQVELDRNGYYRKASRSHDYQPDTAVFPAEGDGELWLNHPFLRVGRNGGPKRKGTQWLASEKARKEAPQ